jgi:hypothetical protein
MEQMLLKISSVASRSTSLLKNHVKPDLCQLFHALQANCY